MKKLFRTVQFLANIGIVLIAIALIAIAVRQYFSPARGNVIPISSVQTVGTSNSSPPPASRPAINPVGKGFPAQNIEWKDKNLVLYLSTTCRYCKESGGFYQRLVKETAGKQVKLVAVLPQSQEEGRSYLADLGVGIKDIYNLPLGPIGVSSTPTLLMVDNKGTVTAMWKGKQNAEGENRILEKLLN